MYRTIFHLQEAPELDLILFGFDKFRLTLLGVLVLRLEEKEGSRGVGYFPILLFCGYFLKDRDP